MSMSNVFHIWPRITMDAAQHKNMRFLGWEFFACINVYVPHACSTHRDQKRFPETGVTEGWGLYVEKAESCMWGLVIESGPSVRAAIALAPVCDFCKHLFVYLLCVVGRGQLSV